jgi:23S rRNA pseudouridine2605 synthase
MRIRLQKYIAEAGVASRRKAEELISAGLVEVNNIKTDKLGATVDPEKDIVKIDGKIISIEKKIYIILNKPAGYVCTSKDTHARKKAIDLIDKKLGRLYTVGRLDRDTEGLLILTNDGNFANNIMHPRKKIPKTYIAKCAGKIDNKKIDSLKKGIILEDGPTLPAEIKLLETSNNSYTIEITIKEGRKRQIKRMIKAVGNMVKYLKRIKIGNLELGNLKLGQYRELSKKEIEKYL